MSEDEKAIPEIDRLRNRREEVWAELTKIDNRIDEIEIKVLPEVREQYVGRCFKNINSYGMCGNGVDWFTYYKVLDVKRNNEATCLCFQITSEGEIEIKANERVGIEDTLVNEISVEEFETELNNTISKLPITFNTEGAKCKN